MCSEFDERRRARETTAVNKKFEPSTNRWWGVTKLVSSTILSGERKQQENKQATLKSVSQFSTAYLIEANASFLAKD